MAKFIYDKYNLKFNYVLNMFSTIGNGTGRVGGYSSYSFEPSTGIISNAGSYSEYNLPVSSYITIYQVIGAGTPANSILRVELDPFLGNNYQRSEATVSTIGSKGTFLENVIGTETQYPLDGIHTDNYWYVRTNTLSETTTPTQPSGGQTIDSNFNIIWTRTATDTNTDIELSFDNGATWKRIASGVTGTSRSYNFISEQETSLARIRTRPVKGDAVGPWTINAGVFTIQHDFAPLAPTNLSPSSIIVSRIDINRLSWKHNHPNAQSKFDLRWSTDQASWNDITRNTTNQYYDAPEELFPAGNIYWQVQTYSDAGIISPWSNVATFISAIPSDAPIITSANTTAIARPTLTWSQVDQVAYQLQVLNSINVVIWDTGEVNSVNKAITLGIDLLNNSTYKIKLRTKTALGLWTTYTEQTITVSYTPPAIPIINLTQDKFSIIISIENPVPVGKEPNVLYNDIYRDGVRIATNILGIYKDNNVASGIEYNYQVVAIGSNGSVNQSIFHQGQITIKHSVITNIFGEILELYANPGRTEEIGYLGEKLFFAGRKKPVMQFEEFEDNNLDLSFGLYVEGDLKLLKTIVARKETVLYRDNRGRKVFGTIRNLSIADDIVDKNWYVVSFTVEEVDYSEVV